MCQLSAVTFHGDTIFCIDYQNQPYTPMRPIVENMGLAWQSQAAKLSANKEKWSVTMIVTVAQDGIEREMLSMPVRKLPAWLNSINPKKVRPELQPKIELYQAESDDALWNYWMHGRAERATSEPTSNSCELSPALRAELKAIVDAKLSAFPARIQGKARSEIWTRFNRNFKIAEYAQLPAERMAEARDYLIEMEVKALKALSPALPKALPAPNPVKAPLLSLTPEELAALDRAAQRVEELNRHVMKEISDLHGDILECVDLRRMPFPAWRVLGAYIYSSLRSAAVLPSGCLEREKNPALAMKMLAGALDER